MEFSQNLLQGTFLKRYKRFFADVDLNGQTVVAHVANTGSLKSVNIPGQKCFVSPASDPNRKLKFTLEMIQVPSGAWVGVNTQIPNQIVKEYLITKYSEVKAEYKISAETRLDFAIPKNNGKFHFIEVKNVTYAENEIAMFPDAVTERGQKHLVELMSLIEQGHTAEIIFTIQRNDVTEFRAAQEIDPEYARLLKLADQKGVLISPYLVDVTEKGIQLVDKKLPFHAS